MNFAGSVYELPDQNKENEVVRTFFHVYRALFILSSQLKKKFSITTDLALQNLYKL